MAETKNTQKKKISFSAFAAILAVMALAIAIVLNLLASRLDVVWDMTPSKMYELSDTTRNYLKELDAQGKKVDLYFLLDMDTLSTDIPSMALYHALEEYSEYDCINLIDFDPDSDPELTAKLQENGYTLNKGDMVFSCEGRTKHVRGLGMYQSEYSTDENGNTVQEAAYFRGENVISGAIDAVVSGRDTVIYFLTGHGEKVLEKDYTTLRRNLSDRNYRTDELNLALSDSVPENAAIVVLAAPQSDLSNDELRKLNEYLDEGGNVCFWMSPNEAAVQYTNIESVLRDFALGMDYDKVAETDSSLHINGDPYTFRCSVVQAESEELDLTSGVADFIDAGIIPFMSSTRSFYRNLSVQEAGITTASLLQTRSSGTDALGNATATAVGEAYGGTDPKAEDIEGEVLDLAMVSTSTMRNNAKIMVMGNAEFIDDSNVSQDYMIIPVNLMLSTISWMYDSDLDMDMGIAAKESTYDSFVLNSENAANTTNIVFTAVPFGVALIGLIVWLRRRYS